MRLAVLAGVLFVLASVLVVSLVPLFDDADTEIAARSWADRLLRDSTLTEYGWVPSDESKQVVDDGLASSAAAYILLDKERRLVGASSRLDVTRSVMLSLGVRETLDVAPLGLVEVTELPILVFGEAQGAFLLLRRGDGPPLPRASLATGAEEDRVAEDSVFGVTFLLLGALLTSVGMFLAAQVSITRRVFGLTDVAAQAIDGALPPRRFAAGSGDELGLLATTLNATRRRAHVTLSSMTLRENRRRDWLSELSHDLRTPLAALQLRLENAHRTKEDDDRRRALATAIQDLERIQSLASGFMDLAQLEVTEDFEFEPVMPEELVGAAVRGLRPIAEDAGVRLVTEIEPQETIFADGHRLLRALENLLRNAIRHAHGEVVAGVFSEGDEVRFFVRDDGDGFSELARDRIVELRDWKGRAQARGLGLRVADRIARAHGGQLLIENSLEGTEVTCVVAAATDEREAVA